MVLGKNVRQTFFRKGARLNPVANSKQFKLNELEMKNKRARERPLTRERARKIGLDLKLVRRDQETRFEGCELKKEREEKERDREKDVVGGCGISYSFES